MITFTSYWDGDVHTSQKKSWAVKKIVLGADVSASDKTGNTVLLVSPEMDDNLREFYCVEVESSRGKELAHSDSCRTRKEAAKKFWEYVETYLE